MDINNRLFGNSTELSINEIELIECSSSVDLTDKFSDFIGIILLESNRFSVTINSEVIIPQDSMILFLGVGNKIQINSLDITHPQYIYTLSFNFDDTQRNEILHSGYLYFSPANILSYIEKFNAMRENQSCNNVTEQLYFKKIFYEFLYDFSNDCHTISECTDIYSKIKSYIDSHYTDTFSIQFLSDLFGVSYNTIERKFKSYVGKTPQQYITELRMKKACKYLKDTTLNIEAIALALGYQDKFYFSRAFKRYQKITPSEYRKSNSIIPKSPTKSSLQSTNKRNVVISNYNRVTIYKTIPNRIVCLSYFAAEVCIALGLADKIVGIAEAEGSISDCKLEFREIIGNIYKIPVKQYTMPDFDEIKKLCPDFVYGASYSFIEQSGIADANEFEKNGMNIYVSKATYSTLSTMQDVYEDIYNIGKIFDRYEQARLIVKEMQYELQIINEQLCDIPSKKIFLYRAELAGKTLTVGMSLESYLLKIAKGINIFEKYPLQRVTRDWEEVAKENPDVIITHESSVDETNTLITKIKTNEALRNVSAIKNNQIYSIPLEHTFPGLHNINLIRTFASHIHGCTFDEKAQPV